MATGEVDFEDRLKQRSGVHPELRAWRFGSQKTS